MNLWFVMIIQHQLQCPNGSVLLSQSTKVKLPGEIDIMETLWPDWGVLKRYSIMAQQFYSELFLFSWESAHVSNMSHRITAMLELYGGRVTGQLKLFRDKDGKSQEAGTEMTVWSYWVCVFIRKTEFPSFYLCVLC